MRWRQFPDAAWVPRALRPNTSPWAVRRAIWAVLAASLVAGAGVITGDRVVTGLTYFGVACAAVFVTSGVYRTRAISLLCQGIGAAAGIVLGVAVADDSVAVKVGVAAAVAMLSGMIGGIGASTTAGALMAVVGLGFGEFARVRLPGWEQGSWYLVGTLLVAVFALAGWPVARDRPAWAAIAAVFDRAANLMQHADDFDAAEYRAALASASRLCRSEVFDHRLSARFAMRGGSQRIAAAAGTAEQAAYAAAQFFADGRLLPGNLIEQSRLAAVDCRAGRLPILPALSCFPRVVRSVAPQPQRLRTAVRVSVSPAALLAGLRLAVCIAIATAATCALHSESHSFWLPLTVAVAVRPEYASVFVRTVNRIAGTAAGALVAVVAIAVLGSGWPVAIAAAVSLGFAVLAAPKLYGLGVVGITCSALLSSCIGAADPLNPAVRLLDTALGCVIAIVFGYLIWRRATGSVDLAPSADAIEAYLRLAVTPPSERTDWVATRDRAYLLAHESRRAAQAGLLEPHAVRASATEVLPRALRLESLVDEITAIANRVDSGAAPPTARELAELTRRVQAAATPNTATPRLEPAKEIQRCQ